MLALYSIQSFSDPRPDPGAISCPIPVLIPNLAAAFGGPGGVIFGVEFLGCFAAGGIGTRHPQMGAAEQLPVNVR